MTDQSKLNTTILLLVSDRLVRSVIGETLDREGYMVIPVGDLGSAVDWLKTSTPDLLIVRTYVSDMEGHDAAKYLQTKCPSMRVLMVGGLLAGCGKIVLSERFLPLLRDLVRVRKHLAGIFRVVGAPRVRFRAVRRHYDPDSLRGNSGGHQVSHAHQIVGRTGEGKHPIHFQRSAMPHLA